MSTVSAIDTLEQFCRERGFLYHPTVVASGAGSAIGPTIRSSRAIPSSLSSTSP